jgi:putative ABC transport system substrate-binding protein
MRRREFMAGLGSAAAWPVVSRAQQAAVPVIGFLSAQSAEVDYKAVTVPFIQGLKETGYVVGQNVAVEYRYAENRFDRLPALVADLVFRRAAVIVATGTTAALAAKAATATIPIAFNTGGDPVALGLVASLNRPGGNLTGSAVLEAELAPKRLQLLREFLPNAALFGVLADPAFPSTPSLIAGLQAAARMLGLQLVVATARTDSDLETAFTFFSEHSKGALAIENALRDLPKARVAEISVLTFGCVISEDLSHQHYAQYRGWLDGVGLLNSEGHSPEYRPFSHHSTNTYIPFSMTVADSVCAINPEAVVPARPRAHTPLGEATSPTGQR